MKNNESDYNTDSKTVSTYTENDKDKQQPEITVPGDSEEKPAKILPIIDKDKKQKGKDNNEVLDENNLNAGINEADEMDNSGAAGE